MWYQYHTIAQSNVTIFANSLQGHWKQSVDGQAQLDVGGEDVNNSRAKCAAKFWT